MDERLKILPMVALGALILFSVKLFGVWTGFQGALDAVAPAKAGDAEPSGQETEQENEPGGGRETGADNPPADEQDQDDPLYDAPISNGMAVSDPAFMSESEIRVLQSLADRRATLEARERELAMEQKLLVATEKRIEERIAELKALEARIEGLLIQKDEEEEAQIASLVKVYENMKAKDAARIFENLNKDILLAVAVRMREQKIAAILAQMNPTVAQDLTVLMAKHAAPPVTEG